MAKENNKNIPKDNDGKGKSSCCCAGCLGMMVISLITWILIAAFIIVPIYKKYGDDIKSHGLAHELRNILADKIDEWNYRYIRPAQDKVYDLRQGTEEAVENAKQKVKDLAKNPDLIIEKIEDAADDALLD